MAQGVVCGAEFPIWAAQSDNAKFRCELSGVYWVDGNVYYYITLCDLISSHKKMFCLKKKRSQTCALCNSACHMCLWPLRVT